MQQKKIKMQNSHGALEHESRLTRELFEFPLHWVASGEAVILVSTFVVPKSGIDSVRRR